MSDPQEFKPELPVKLADQLFLGKKFFCQWCDAEIEGFRNKQSAKEFRATGKCQMCQDTFKRKNERSRR
jgi:hypothetical protein